MKITVNNEAMTVPTGAIAYKYSDPVEDARWVHDAADLDAIRREDASLIAWAR
jgi:hypothetical protein